MTTRRTSNIVTTPDVVKHDYDAQRIVYPGASQDLADTHKGRLHRDLLEFLRD